MLIFHTQLIDPERGIIRSSVCHRLSDAKATLAAYMVDYTGSSIPTTMHTSSLIEWFNENQEAAVITCAFYDPDDERSTEFVAWDERGNKPAMTVGEAIALADEDEDEGEDDDDDGFLMNVEAAGHA